MRSTVSIIETMLDIGIRGLGGSHGWHKDHARRRPHRDGRQLLKSDKSPRNSNKILSYSLGSRLSEDCHHFQDDDHNRLQGCSTSPARLQTRCNRRWHLGSRKEITCHLVTTTAYYVVLFGWTPGKSRLVGLPARGSTYNFKQDLDLQIN